MDGIVGITVLTVVTEKSISKAIHCLLCSLQTRSSRIIVITLTSVLGTIIPESDCLPRAISAGPALQRYELTVDKTVKIRTSAVGRAIRPGAGLGIHRPGPVHDHDHVDLLDLFFRVAFHVQGDGVSAVFFIFRDGFVMHQRIPLRRQNARSEDLGGHSEPHQHQQRQEQTEEFSPLLLHVANLSSSVNVHGLTFSP